MSKKKKILVIIISVILAVVLGFGIFYLISPRTFLQLFMSDVSYATTVISKNAMKAYKNIDALEVTGDMSTDLSVSMLNDENLLSDINNYISGLDIKANVYMNDGEVKGIADFSDEDGSVLTAEFVSASKKSYLKIDQFDLGWLDISKEESSTSESSGTSSTNPSSEPAKIEDLVSVNGNTIGIYCTVSELEQGVVSNFVPDEYKTKFESTIKSFTSGLINYGFDSIEVQVYVDNRNNITGLKMILNGAESDVTIEATIGDGDCFTEIYAHTNTYGSVLMNLNIKPCEFESFEIPTNATKFDKTVLKSAAITYVTTTLPDEHPAFKEVYESVFSSLISNTITQLFGDLLGGNTNSVDSNIIDSLLSTFTNIAKE